MRCHAFIALTVSTVVGIAQLAHGQVLVHESAEMGESGWTHGSGRSAGIFDGQWLGARFSLTQTVKVTGVGGHLIGDENAASSPVFAAIVSLTGPSALPAGLPFTADEVVAFGDAENDLEMFRAAGAAVAMGQADEQTRAAADFVTRTNEEAGVAYAIDRILERGSV